MATVANLQVQIGATIKGLEGSLKKAESSLNKFAKNATAIGGTLSKALTVPLTGFATASVFAFDKQAKAVAQVEQAILSTGGAAGKTSKELQKMASSLQENSLFGDEEILQKVTAQLLTFTNISGNAFDRTQQAALDLATRLGGDLQSASIQLGKALNDPVANLSALSRAGIQFSEEQKELIDALVETGRLAEAQTVILDELEKQYGGSAKAAAAAGAGGITQLKNSFGDLMEQIGEVIVEAILPFVDRLKEIVKQLQATDKETLKFYVTIGALSAAIGPALIALGAMAKGLTAVKVALMFTFKNPYVLVTAGVVALIGYFTTLYIKAKRVNDLLKEPFDSTLPIDEQIQKAIERVDALDKRVTGMRKNLGIGVTTEEGAEAQQRQLRVAENRLSVERQMLIELIAQNKVIKDRPVVVPTEEDISIPTPSPVSVPLVLQPEPIADVIKKTEEALRPLEDLLEFDYSVPDKLFPPGSIGYLQTRISTLSELMRGMTNPEDIEAYRLKIEQLQNQLSQLQTGVEGTNQKFIDFGQNLQSAVTSSISSFAETIGNAFTGDAGAEGFFNNILVIVAEFGMQLGKALIAAGAAALAFQKLLINPIGAIAAGTALVATSAVVRNLLKDGPKQQVNDALITSSGKVIEFSPKDNILAMQDFGNLKSNSSGVQSIRVSVDDIRLSGSDILIALRNAERAYG